MSKYSIKRSRPATTWFLLTALLLAAKTTSASDSIAVILEHNPSSIDSALPEGVDTETGFRMEHYRRPVPVSNPGTETVDTARALQLQRSGKVLLIDVYPPRGLGADPIDGHWLTNEKHESLPGATWLPEVGRGHIEQEHIDYFTRNLELLTEGDKTTPMMFYCTADCWQSWNAARRALQWGYQTIFWYPAGTHGWLEEGHELVPIEPINFFGG